MDQQPESNGFVRFWTTLPGLLTAAAAVITAIGTIYVTSTVTKNTVGPSPVGPVPVVVSTVTTVPTTPPSVPADIPVASLSLGRVDANSTRETGVDSLINACASGDDSACAQIIRILANGCDQGDGLSCDLLYEVSAPGSDLELFGASCGGRVSTDFADQCATL